MRVSSSNWKVVRTRLGLVILALGVLLARPAIASATVTYTYYPSGSAGGDNDLDDLDHHYYYSWEITGLGSLVSQGITSASITFKDMYNWDAKANVLFLDLLDSATLSTSSSIFAASGEPNVRYAQDSTIDTPTSKSQITDAFDSTNLLSSSAKTDLSDRSFVAQYVSPTNTSTLFSAMTSLGYTTSQANALISPSGWTVGTVQGVNGGYDYTYTFTASQLTALGTYIANGGDIALAFDPDCHFFNDGVSFQIVTNGVGITSAVPEPASLLLLGVGLVIAGRYRRRAKKQTN